ncbi:N-acetylmuramoyl-L-alanine amidase family protein [Zavarzinia sp. CC-PAN008]|uniref:N-acetylmuramoyl-L-alanine amidase family protein n=1 Tax=Zavarzinia sp. CC-PAN008 TaxID=3243332 RepID=UPI003F744E85
MRRREVLKLALGLPLLLEAGGTATAQELGRTLALAVPPPRAKPPVPPLPAGARIVLDAGHGGRDPGAIGLSGIYEKDVVLDLVLQMARRIEAEGRHKVILTRSRDVFLPLVDRAMFAHDQKADLFISVHADSAPNPMARGLSAYTLSETASDALAGAMAERENAADFLAGVDLGAADREVAAILFDLARRHSLNAALERKALIVDAVAADLRLLQNPRRSANFAVLKVPDVPSILIETGFLSNAQDEALLADPASRRRIATTLADAIGSAAITA